MLLVIYFVGFCKLHVVHSRSGKVYNMQYRMVTTRCKAALQHVCLITVCICFNVVNNPVPDVYVTLVRRVKHTQLIYGYVRFTFPKRICVDLVTPFQRYAYPYRCNNHKNKGRYYKYVNEMILHNIVFISNLYAGYTPFLRMCIMIVV